MRRDIQQFDSMPSDSELATLFGVRDGGPLLHSKQADEVFTIGPGHVDLGFVGMCLLLPLTAMAYVNVFPGVTNGEAEWWILIAGVFACCGMIGFFWEWNSRNKAAGPYCVADIQQRILRLPRFDVAVKFEDVEAVIVVCRQYRKPWGISPAWAELSVLLKRDHGRFDRHPIAVDSSEEVISGMAGQLCQCIEVPCRAYRIRWKGGREVRESCEEQALFSRGTTRG